LEDFE
jgi:hypothetical protein